MSTLSFPNRSRSFDATKDRVRFWGYDSAIEITFFVEGTTLRKLGMGHCNSEIEILGAFDTAQERILRAANKVYARGVHSGSYVYVLAPGDF